MVGAADRATPNRQECSVCCETVPHFFENRSYMERFGLCGDFWVYLSECDANAEMAECMCGCGAGVNAHTAENFGPKVTMRVLRSDHDDVSMGSEGEEWRRCPHCGQAIIKHKGCEQMVCGI